MTQATPQVTKRQSSRKSLKKQRAREKRRIRRYGQYQPIPYLLYNTRHYTGQVATIKCARHIDTRNTTHHQTYTITSVKAKSSHGRTVPTTIARAISNQRFDTTGSHNQRIKNAQQRTITRAEIGFVKST